MNSVIAEDYEVVSLGGIDVICNELIEPSIYIKLDRGQRDIRITSNTKPFEYIKVNGVNIRIKTLSETISSLELYMKRNLFKATLLLISEEEKITKYENMGYGCEDYLSSIGCHIMKKNLILN